MTCLLSIKLKFLSIVKTFEPSYMASLTISPKYTVAQRLEHLTSTWRVDSRSEDSEFFLSIRLESII